jgi:phosphate uptake regulator
MFPLKSDIYGRRADFIILTCFTAYIAGIRILSWQEPGRGGKETHGSDPPMKRKAVQHGPSTLIVSLPTKWVVKNNIARGAELDVVEKGNELVISAQPVPREKKIEVDISGLDRSMLIYTVRALYRQGYDEILLRFNSPVVVHARTGEKTTVLSLVHQEINRLIGFEVMEEHEDSCLITDLEEVSLKDFDQVLRRILLLLVDLTKDLLERLRAGDAELLGIVEEKHDTITKFISYCLRLLNKRSHPRPEHTPYYFHIIALLDRITDIIKFSARDLRTYGKKPGNELLGIVAIIAEQVEQYSKLFYAFENSRITTMNEQRYKAEQLLRRIKSAPSAEMIAAASLFQILETATHLIEARTALEY